MGMTDKMSLYCQEGSSDKFYIIWIMEEDVGFTVHYHHGRRGEAGHTGFKNKEPLPYDKAKKLFDSTIKQKTTKSSKPYQIGTGGKSTSVQVPAMTVPVTNVTGSGKIQSGILPQLLCPIEDDEVELFLKDPHYGAQEKKDGRRKFIQSMKSVHTSINRKGQEVGYPAIFEAACEAIINSKSFYNFPEKAKIFLIDGEEVDDTLHVFDMLTYGSTDLRNKPYQKRYNILKDVIGMAGDCAFKLVPLAITEKEKRALYEKLKKEEKEGIVFKLLDAPYTEGRSTEEYVTYAQKCPQVKNKFYATASCIVIRINTKRSIGLGLYNGTELIDHGNCTIPPNKEIPEKGNVVEIRMLYCFKGGKIYQPTYLGPRDDIDKKECVVSKLKYKPEED